MKSCVSHEKNWDYYRLYTRIYFYLVTSQRSMFLARTKGDQRLPKKKKIIGRIYVRYVSAVQHFRFGELNSGWKIGGVTEQMAEPGWMSLNKSLAPEHRSFSPPFISTLQFFFSSLLQSRIRIQFSILASMDLYKKNQSVKNFDQPVFTLITAFIYISSKSTIYFSRKKIRYIYVYFKNF